MTRKRAGWLVATVIVALILAAVFLPTETKHLPQAKESVRVPSSGRMEKEETEKSTEQQIEDTAFWEDEMPDEDEAERNLLEYEPKGRLFLDENFDYAIDTFGFDAASLKNGALRLTENMQPRIMSVKSFDYVIMGQSMVEVSFCWKSDFSDIEGKSGLEFRDLYGSFLFAVSGCYNETTGKHEFRYAIEGAANNSTQSIEPKWTTLSYTPGKTYTVFLRADFLSKEVSALILEEDGSIVAEIKHAATTATSLAKMAACNYGQTGKSPIQTIDDFKLYISDDAGAFPLAGKRVIAFGDSIVDGHLYKEAGFVEFLAEKEGMQLEYNYANNGARIMPGSTVNEADELGGTIRDVQVNAAAMDNRNPDYIIFDGGANDAYSGILLHLGTVKETDTTTFAGAFRSTIRTMHDYWPNAKIVYVAVHKLSVREERTQERLYELEMAICKDMGVEVADLYANGWDTSNAALNRKSAFDALDAGQIPIAEENSNGVHPNFLAIEEFYVPIVSTALKNAKDVTILENEPREETGLNAAEDRFDSSNERAMSITFERDSYEIAAGKAVTLEPKITSSDGVNWGLNWSITSNAKYASINVLGNTCEVKTKKGGAGKTVIVTAEAADGSGVTKEIEIKLLKHAVTKVAIKANKQTLRAGTKITLKASVKTSGAKANKNLEWISSNPDYAALRPNKDGSQCIVTAKAAGAGKTVVLTVQSTDGTDKSAEIQIRVK